MGTPVGTPTPTDPSQPTGATPSVAAGLAPPSVAPAPALTTPPGLAPAGTESADMDGIEEVGEDDEVVVVGQPDTSGARAA
eukprot:7556605-Alexandrium_andersonii.AAC.1